VSQDAITIRRATLQDADAIAAIYNEAVQNSTATFDTESKTEEDRREWLESHDDRHPVLVAECDGQIVGWASLSKWSDRPAYADTAESSFYVSEQHRGRGIGRALKVRMIEEARQAGLHTILARVAEGSAASLHLNEALGFERVGTMREVGLKFGRRLDVHLLQLMLQPDTALPDLTIHRGGVPMTISVEQVTRAALDEANAVFDQCQEKIEHCLEQLTDEQVWWRPHPSLNSIGNLILHLSGNVRQWIVSGIGGAQDVRNRPNEFSEQGPIPKDDLRGRLIAVVNDAKAALDRATCEEMLRTRRIQGFDVTGWAALWHTVPHFNGHTQEIICLTRVQLGDGYRFLWQPQTTEQGAPGAP
jgi:phosphinothricin acetyltransferase